MKGVHKNMALYKFIFFLNWLYASQFNFLVNGKVENINAQNIEFRSNDDRTVIVFNFFHKEEIKNIHLLNASTQRKYSKNSSYENPSYSDSYDRYSIIRKADTVSVVGNGKGYYKISLTINTKDFHPQWI